MIPLHYEDVVIGEEIALGSHRFELPEMLDFARAYDPQPFHLDEAAARVSHFGALSASGWLTAANWMACYIATVARAKDQLSEAERAAMAPHVSPGFVAMRWPRPVFAGETVHYSTRATAKRPLASRPAFGLVEMMNTGVNAQGALAFSFEGRVFLPRRAPEL